MSFQRTQERKGVLQEIWKQRMANLKKSHITCFSVFLEITVWRLQLLPPSCIVFEKSSLLLSWVAYPLFPWVILVKFISCPSTSPTTSTHAVSMTRADTGSSLNALLWPSLPQSERWHPPWAVAFVRGCLPWRAHTTPKHDGSSLKVFPH